MSLYGIYIHLMYLTRGATGATIFFVDRGPVMAQKRDDWNFKKIIGTRGREEARSQYSNFNFRDKWYSQSSILQVQKNIFSIFFERI